MQKLIYTSLFIICTVISCTENKPDPKPKQLIIESPNPTVVIPEPPKKAIVITPGNPVPKVDLKKMENIKKDSTKHD